MSFLSNINPIRIAQAVLNPGEVTAIKHFEDRDAAVNALQIGGEIIVATAFKPDGTPAKSQKLTIKDIQGPNFFLVDEKGVPYPRIAKGEQPAGVSYAELHARLERSPSYDRQKSVDAMMAQLRDDVNHKQSSAVSLRWGDFDAGTGQFGVPIGTTNQVDPKHFVNVTNIDDKRVYYRNSHGSEESMDIDSFKRRLDGAVTTGPKV